MKTVLLRSSEVATLVLTDFDVPGPGGARGCSVNIYIDGHTGVTGGHPHVLPGVVATDYGWGVIPRHTDYE